MVKRVRIQSPVISPDEPHQDPFDARLNDQGHSGSPPPPDDEPDVAAELRRSFIDSVARGASNLNPKVVGDVPPQSTRTGLGTETTASRVAHQQPIHNTAMEQFSNNPSSKQSTYSPGPQQAPYNPFARTLTSIEGNYVEEKSVEDVASEQVGQGTGKAAMDVDAFTRMLLTGKPAPSVPSPQAAPGLLSIPTDGSSTENSSISRHTLSDSSLGLHLESPRSSYEDSRSESSADATEHSSLMRDAQPKKAKPPPPANHRGKLLSHKGPQTVSFADFDITVSPDAAQNSPASSSLDSSRLPLSRSPSDLNKPLPPPPSLNSPDSSLTTLPSQSPSQEDDKTRPSKIAPPPPPVPRRTSSTRVDGLTSRPRSSSQLSKSSFAGDFEESPPSLTSPPQSQLGKPPPPPTRRPLSIIPSVDREASVSSQASTAKAPPPPPSRQSLRGTTTLTRTPSTTSTASIGHRRISPSLSGPTPPPPPPPRRGDKRSSLDGRGIHPGPTTRHPSDGSQRGSIELRRSSNTSLNHGRPPSISSLQYVGEAGEDAADTSAAQNTDVNSGKDILADLSAFQAEIDALRAQIGR